jgi:hypothetical protein
MSKIPKFLYHGTAFPMKAGDILNIGQNFDSNMAERLSGVWATSSLDKAKAFGIFGCVKGRGFSVIDVDGKRLFMQNISENPKHTFYVCTLDSSGFEVDRGDEYINRDPSVVADVESYGVENEAGSGGYRLYQFDSLPASAGKPAPPEEREIFERYIAEGKYREIDLPSMFSAARLDRMKARQGMDR